jgi:hypothetical protein
MTAPAAPGVSRWLDWRNILLVALTQFAPWLAAVVVVSFAGYPGVVCVTPLAWLMALRVGLVSVERSRSPVPGTRLREAALAGSLFGLLQGLLFWVVIPRMGPILPSEQQQAIVLVAVVVLVGIVLGALLALLTAFLREQRRRRENG